MTSTLSPRRGGLAGFGAGCGTSVFGGLGGLFGFHLACELVGTPIP